MPRGDRRGPEGRGSMTGRGLGYCAGNHQPGFAADAAPQGAGRGPRNGAGRGPGFGRGLGRAHGRGHGRAFAVGNDEAAYQSSTYENQTEDFNSQEDLDREITRLENIANTLSSELEIVKRKIDELKNY